MGNFGRALAGGIAGAVKASGEVFDDQMKAQEYDRKSAILEKRDKTLATFRQGLMLERDKSQYAQQDLVRSGNRTYAESSEQSGMVNSMGMPMRKRDLAQQSPQESSGNVSVKDYKAKEKATDWTDEKKELDYKQKNAIELVQVRKQNQSFAKPDKISVAEKNYAQDNARKSIDIILASYMPIIDPLTKIPTINIEGIDQTELDSLKTYIKSKGFELSTLKTADGKEMKIQIGGFDYDKYKKNLDSTPKVKPDAKVKTDEEKAAERFDYLLSILAALEKKEIDSKVVTTPGSNVNGDSSSSNMDNLPESIATPGINWDERLAPLKDVYNSSAPTFRKSGKDMTKFVNRIQQPNRF